MPAIFAERWRSVPSGGDPAAPHPPLPDDHGALPLAPGATDDGTPKLAPIPRSSPTMWPAAE